jgi:PHD/YefM family antitoxin component YafN of YafNO toxin-antitoxin module
MRKSYYNPNYILLSQADWEALVETTKWLQVPNIISDVESARREYANNETLTMDQVFES